MMLAATRETAGLPRRWRSAVYFITTPAHFRNGLPALPPLM